VSKSFRDRNPFLIAVASLTAMVLLLVGVFVLKSQLEHTFPISAEFSDAAGVTKGAPVRVAGVQVGKVSKVTPDRANGRVIIRLAINRGVQLGPNTRAEVALATLLGAKYVKLSGKVAAPYLQAGAVIPNERTATPYDIFEIAKVGTKKIEDTDNEKLNRLINQLATVTDGKETSIRELIEGIAKLSTAVAARDNELDDLVSRANTISGTLADKDQTLAALLDQSDALLKVLAARHDQLAQGIHDASSAFGQLAGIVDKHKAEIDAILTTLHPTVDILDRHQADLDRTLNWLGEGAYGLSLAASHGSWADVFVRALGPDVIGLLEQLTGQGLGG
jgi:phospholipid/cholesterol/gamma-HCH transport system substrate-binding protein